MKKTTMSILTCSLTNEQIGKRSAVALYGKLVKLDERGEAGEVVLESDVEGDAVLVSALVDRLRGPSGMRQPKGKIAHASVDEIVKAVREHNGAASTKKICELLGREPRELRKGLKAAVGAGRLSSVAKGVYQYLRQHKAA